MICSVGVDLIATDRVLASSERESFLKRAFTRTEIDQAEGRRHRLAGDYAVKEAVAKCFGTGLKGFDLTDIEVLRYDNGKPYVRLSGEALRLYEELGLKAIHVSISDDAGMTVALAIAEK